ncbi:MAG: CpXC domain-containing protein [Spirochaetaceae bacterium]|nr:CpXC domain-containing protein [Spirochaetaceae bacterium]
MKRKIPCFCDNTFSVEVPAEIDLDVRPEYIGEIMDGSFMTFTCSSCGKKHKPEFPMTILWPSRNLRLEVIPELDRGGFYRKKQDNRKTGTETLIGYPEMADRIAVYRDGLEPAAIEALKYYLLLKAEEAYPDREITIWYQNRGPDNLELHLHGLKEDEVAVTQVPTGVYEKTLEDYKKHPKAELFASLRFGSYLSVQNMRRP